MSFSKTRLFDFKILEAGQLARAIEGITGKAPKRCDIQDHQDLADGGHVTHEYDSPSKLATICDITNHVILASIKTNSEKYRHVMIRNDTGLIEIRASADTVDDMQDVLTTLTQHLEIKEVSDEALKTMHGPTRKEIAQRLAAIEKIVIGPNRPLRCFFSYRFSPENEDPARKLTDFLILLGIDVVTGNTYEPRPISQKVKDKLNHDIDFIVLLITSDGESFWTRDEISHAQHTGIPLIPIVEQGTSFSSGLFGDLEYVTFTKGHVGDAFLKLLQAVKFIRERSKPVGSLPHC